ncbi:hypothetical protein H310_10361 [Aphanomyces invadans]|uniref:Ankyrin repeat-containing domain n=1 Tax=Aphanomyces invadans TaxID=157072 RepID=A0A024TQ74_9STRA|nr:hypothetical protein H310_10361 [Aphanomyces invadans]ETV96159.1 hypothetical protein H310_10361 [Aphanomyces invadans]|eukprot:XP_008874951.1 hypothetical protein H310_10361 [Aphanomyces invadans]
MAAAKAVLVLPSLVRDVTQFQDGLTEELAIMLHVFHSRTFAHDEAKAAGLLEALQCHHTNSYLAQYLGCRPGGIDSRHVDAAAQMGYMETVEYLCASGFPLSMFALPKAAAAGHVDVVQFVFHHVDRHPQSARIAMNHASHAGHLAVVQFLYEHRLEELTIVPIVCAANAGQHNVEMYLRSRFQGGVEE